MAVRLTQRTAAIAGAAVVVLVVAVGWFLLVSPQRSKASDLGVQIDAAQTKLVLALAEARTLRRGTHARERELATLNKALPSDVHMSQLIRELSSAAAAAGVDITSIGPGTPMPGTVETI